MIPEEERNEVVGYNIKANYYYHADIVPCYKYFTFQKWMTTKKLNVYKEFMLYVINEHPLWVIVPVDEKDKTLDEILKNDYSCKLSDSAYLYYRCKNY